MSDAIRPHRIVSSSEGTTIAIQYDSLAASTACVMYACSAYVICLCRSCASAVAYLPFIDLKDASDAPLIVKSSPRYRKVACGLLKGISASTSPSEPAAQPFCHTFIRTGGGGVARFAV